MPFWRRNQAEERTRHEHGLALEPEDAVDVGLVSDLYILLAAIDRSMPKDAVLVLEDPESADVRRFVRERQPPRPPQVRHETVFPPSAHFHLPLEGDNLAKLREMAERL